MSGFHWGGDAAADGLAGLLHLMLIGNELCYYGAACERLSATQWRVDDGGSAAPVAAAEAAARLARNRSADPLAGLIAADALQCRATLTAAG